ncbi:MAG: glycosyltransferase family 4 protein, partial [Chloroflexi bacterium]|nr:glycosyltransferase family 4 protein [Chloroflexota bacterium]
VRRHVEVIANGIDLELFDAEQQIDARAKFGLPKDRLVILFTGRMEKRKGLRYLLSAYATLKWEYPQLRLIVVGPGKLDPPSTSILGERMMKDVEFVGPVSYADLPRYYRTADIFCSPAIGHESFGIVLLEAMAAGKPVIASNIPGYATLVRDGDQGLLVPPKDDAALASAIVRLANNPELRQAMGARGREFSKGFSWDKVAQRVMDYYLRLMEGRDSIRRIESA